MQNFNNQRKILFRFGWRLQDPGNPLYHVLYSYLCIPIGANGETSNICVSFHHLLNFNLFVCYSSRPRSPIARSRASRRRYESPPFEGQRGGGGGKYARGHGSPQSPHHRYPFSPTPPPPVRGGGGRSPPGMYILLPYPTPSCVWW